MSNHLTIPEIRAQIVQIADELRLEGRVDLSARLRDLADATYRRSPVRRAKVSSVEVTGEVARKIRAFAEHFPRAPNTVIARVFHVNPGRVSEVLAGKRGA